MKPLDGQTFRRAYYRAYGIEDTAYAVVIDEDLSPGYPVCFYAFDGAFLVALAPGLEEAVEPLADERPLGFAAIMEFLFEGGVSYEEERVLGFYLSRTSPACAAARRIQGSEAEKIVEGFKKINTPRDWTMGGVHPGDAYFVCAYEDETPISICGANVLGDLADISVIVHPAFRGKGYGKMAVQGLCRLALEDGKTPFYRTEEENSVSVRLAKSLGFSLGFTMTGAPVTYG